MCQRCAEVPGERVPEGVCEEKMALGICPHIIMPEATFHATKLEIKAPARQPDPSLRFDGGVLLTADGIPLMGD